MLGTLRYHNADGNENVKKAIGWIGKTTSLDAQHAFLYISLPSLHVKKPNFKFYGGRERHQNSSLAFDKVSELE